MAAYSGIPEGEKVKSQVRADKWVLEQPARDLRINEQRIENEARIEEQRLVDEAKVEEQRLEDEAIKRWAEEQEKSVKAAQRAADELALANGEALLKSEEDEIKKRATKAIQKSQLKTNEMARARRASQERPQCTLMQRTQSRIRWPRRR